ncbi:MAG TPA: pyridoxal-phosphate dependent enzyme [Acidimicrobiia bacterium]|nr:pyridoxal-phosphate dependent enzyme [Acidimicrobiia bacterium]
MTAPWPTIDAIRQAAKRIDGVATRTPLVPSFGLSRARNAEVRIKLETTQPTRSFKVRGAANVILSRDPVDPGKGVVAYSTGNHGRAVAYVASMLGLTATVCMSHNTTRDKQHSLRAMGAAVRLVGQSQDEAAELARSLEAEGALLVDPINDPLTTAGQGTIGLEIVEDWPEVDTVVVPVSGGALMAGIAQAVKSLAPATRVVGVSMERGAAMYESLRAGHPVAIPEVESLADSLQGGITLDNDHSFEMVRALVEDLVLVTEEEIGLAMAEAVIEERVVLEGAGATPLAALISRDRSLFGDRIALVATGAMVADTTLTRLVEEHREAVARTLGRTA